MFSALALMAFSFAGMANTGPKNELNLEKISSIKAVKNAPKEDCSDFVFAMIDFVIGNEEYQSMSDEDALEISNSFNEICFLVNSKIQGFY